MIILKEFDLIRVCGKNAHKWKNENDRLISGHLAVFDSDVFYPDVSTGKDKHFELPCHRGQGDYQIHILENEEALIVKDGSVFLCTLHGGLPVVLKFDPVPVDKQLLNTIGF